MYIKRVKANLVGRDFVCGDIHGSFSCVEKFLISVGFNPEVDRLFCAGDLVDRGPENELCLELLLQPWFFMCKGNHEELMESYFNGSPLGMWWLRNGGMWGAHYKSEISNEAMLVKDVALEIIPNLPSLITVEKKDGGIFHVLHAEIYAREPITDADMADETVLKKYSEAQALDGSAIMWGREMFGMLYDAHINDRILKKFSNFAQLYKIDKMYSKNLSHIYSGHTCVRHPITYKGQTNLDTQAYRSYRSVIDYHGVEKFDEYCGLTITEPETGKFWFSNDRVFKEIEPIVVKDYHA